MMVEDRLRARLDAAERRAFIVGSVALAGCALGAVSDGTQFLHSYLLAFVFWSGIPLGCLAVLMLHHLVGGGWGFLIRRPLEAGIRTLPIVAILVMPLVLGVRVLYVWSHAETVAADPLLQHKHVYLNVPFFVARTVGYFAIWLVVAHYLDRWSEDQDRVGAPELSSRLYALSGPGLIVYGLTVTFASLDWIMSLEPDWFSTIYSALFMVGQVLSALAFLTVLLVFVSGSEPLADVASSRYLNDLGNMILTFVILWAYMSFSQFLIIWSGNLTDEIGWYLRRVQGGWQWVAAFLLAGHFTVPFLLLLSREIKQHVRSLSALAAALLLMRFVDMWWNVEPAFDPGAVHVHWMDGVAALGVGGIWIAAFIGQLKRRPLLPLHDPELPEVLAGAAERVS